MQQLERKIENNFKINEKKKVPTKIIYFFTGLIPKMNQISKQKKISEFIFY